MGEDISACFSERVKYNFMRVLCADMVDGAFVVEVLFTNLVGRILVNVNLFYALVSASTAQDSRTVPVSLVPVSSPCLRVFQGNTG